jgi:hypothetical protein
VWLWDLSAAAQRVTASRTARPAGLPGDEVETRVRHRVEALLRPIENTHQKDLMWIGRTIALSLIAWYLSVWILHFEILSGLVVTLMIGPVLVVLALWLRGTWLARRAVRQFNQTFPEQGAERGMALETLAGLKSRASVLKRIKKALGVPAAPGAPGGLSSLQGVSVATDARFLSALVFAPSGPAFAALTETGLRLYRLDGDGQRLTEQSLAGAEVHPRAVPAFTPDGASLVVRLRNGSLQAWEVATGRPRGPVRGPANGPVLVYAPDGRSAVTVNADGTASLWDVEAGKEQAVLDVEAPPNVTVRAPAEAARGPEDLLQQGVYRAAFSPDGRTLALADGVSGVAWCDAAEARRAAGCQP